MGDQRSGSHRDTPRPSDPMMGTRGRRRRLAARLGGLTGVAFVLVMAAGADRPPPPGFLLIAGYGALLAVAIARALPGLLDVWDTRGPGPALGRATLWGFLGGLALWAVTTVVSTGGPTAQVDATARLIGFAVVGMVGAFGAAALLATARLVDRRHRST